jgi:hypothetical protein
MGKCGGGGENSSRTDMFSESWTLYANNALKYTALSAALESNVSKCMPIVSWMDK